MYIYLISVRLLKSFFPVISWTTQVQFVNYNVKILSNEKRSSGVVKLLSINKRLTVALEKSFTGRLFSFCAIKTFTIIKV